MIYLFANDDATYSYCLLKAFYLRVGYRALFFRCVPFATSGHAAPEPAASAGHDGMAAHQQGGRHLNERDTQPYT